MEESTEQQSPETSEATSISLVEIGNLEPGVTSVIMGGNGEPPNSSSVKLVVLGDGDEERKDLIEEGISEVLEGLEEMMEYEKSARIHFIEFLMFIQRHKFKSDDFSKLVDLYDQSIEEEASINQKTASSVSSTEAAQNMIQFLEQNPTVVIPEVLCVCQAIRDASKYRENRDRSADLIDPKELFVSDEPYRRKVKESLAEILSIVRAAKESQSVALEEMKKADSKQMECLNSKQQMEYQLFQMRHQMSDAMNGILSMLGSGGGDHDDNDDGIRNYYRNHRIEAFLGIQDPANIVLEDFVHEQIGKEKKQEKYVHPNAKNNQKNPQKKKQRRKKHNRSRGGNHR